MDTTPGCSLLRIFFQSLRNGAIHQCRKVLVDGQPEVPICILGDPAYTLLPYLMKEFENGGKDQREKFFRYHLSSARMVIECVFGRLKAKFGSLRRDMDIKLDNLPQCINAPSYIISVKREKKVLIAVN